MKLSSCAFALALGLTVFHAGTARADDLEAPPPPEQVKVHHRSSGAYGAGVALTVTGATFLAGGLVVGVGGLVFAGSSSGDAGAGLALAALGGMVWAGATLVGTAMLVPGIVLMVNNAPREPVFRDARNDPPAPRFTSIPILSGSF